MTPDTPIVEIRDGKVQGLVNDRGVLVFRNIPYGASTAGSGRFMPPRPPQPWTGIRDAAVEGPKSPQASPVFGREALRDVMEPVLRLDQPMSEDCLHVNVFTPGLQGADTQVARRPVMVWLHGGGFASTCSEVAWYDGSNLCRRGDVVVVTLNHRLNVFGYLHLGDILDERFAHSGNNGIADIAQALAWVRDNIAAFGGDPGNVTIFGESGGGAKVTTLMAYPAAKGLFHKAVVMSGPLMRAMSRNGATALARKVLEGLAVGADAAALQQAPIEAILAASQAALAIGLAPSEGTPFVPTATASGGFTPVVDGSSLPAHPFDVSSPPSSADVPLMIGITRDEVQYWTHHDPKIWDDTLTLAELEARVRPFAGARTDAVLAAYAETALSPAKQWVAIQTDRGARAASIGMIERRITDGAAPSYFYIFDWESPTLGGRFRAGHGVDIPFIMDNVEVGSSVVGDQAASADLCAKAYSGALLAFARTGNPSTAQAPWPAYDLKDRATMRFNTQSAVVDDPDAVRRALWIL